MLDLLFIENLPMLMKGFLISSLRRGKKNFMEARKGSFSVVEIQLEILFGRPIV